MQADSTDQAAFERVMDDMLAVGQHLELRKGNALHSADS